MPTEEPFVGFARCGGGDAVTCQRYCSTAGGHNNPNSRRNGDISDDSIQDLDGGNFPRWA